MPDQPKRRTKYDTATAVDASGQSTAISTQVQAKVSSVDLTQTPPVLSINGQNYTVSQLQEIVAAGQRAAGVITQIRDLLKKRTPAKVSLDMNELIREAITLVPHVLKEHKIALRTELAADMPCILGDRIQMEQVILNLIMNGVCQ